MREDAYAQAGVNIEAGNQAVEAMQTAVEATYSSEVVAGLGGFGAAFALPKGYQEPVLVSSADGVGTKLLLAIASDQHATIGQDLVAMVTNDLLAQGATPLFLLDYLGLDKMRPQTVATIVAGIAKAAKQVGAALIGGESAELPGLYANHHYDLAAFGVGIVERGAMLTPANAQAGDILIGLPSSGLHANGYSLVRQILGLKTRTDFQGLTTSEQVTLLRPTILYGPQVGPLLDKHLLASIANITGGGLLENLPRAYGSQLKAELNWDTWPIPPIFQRLQARGQLSQTDMLRTFNNGLGMILVVHPQNLAAVKQDLAKAAYPFYELGAITARQQQEPSVVFKGRAPWPN
ncbi:phosphoribosylformylglycinamidine cyclo-ligase [Weissella halotolerans DSM 20190]|uniref:Phosphoribosylformylglycinamidine cyclo-ligase n=2 Tax=Weissella halotolerans TaxID=1615 RepID=A0A0R2FXV6_9LACO|nr:phosphoribosylformylglycinamidine cyclo-ligase [Weissella halotolerans DSM 20190]